jgi:hypothetical protein
MGLRCMYQVASMMLTVMMMLHGLAALYTILPPCTGRGPAVP